MSRAQVVIDTKFQNAFFTERKGQKWVEVFIPQHFVLRLSELQFFLQKLGSNWDVSSFFFEKYRFYGSGEAKY